MTLKPVLHDERMAMMHFDRLIGRGRWLPRQDLRTFPVRFPAGDPGDAGWHIDASYGTGTNYHKWRVNIDSRDRALLMLFLFSDVGPDDAPTRLLSGSHFDIARRLKPAGKKGAQLASLFAGGFAESEKRPEVVATGDAGTVYLCHPFLVHAPQSHRGTRPRFLAQPPLVPAKRSRLTRGDGRILQSSWQIRRAF
jgi:Phytanoyl-CoA dioxygenase (PhyH)